MTDDVTDLGILIRMALAIYGGVAIMSVAGHLSWMRSDLTGWRFYGPLIGGLTLSGILGYCLLSTIVFDAWVQFNG